jgi:hypothetical protein
VQVVATILLPVLAIAASCLTVYWIRQNRSHLDAVWPTMLFSGAAALPGLVLFGDMSFRVVAVRMGFAVSDAPPYEWPVTLTCCVWLGVGAVLLFISRVPARPETIPKGLRLVQASHTALWIVSSLLALAFVADA